MNDDEQPVNDFLAEIIFRTEAVKFGCSMILVVILIVVLALWK
jgi:hypothetical protein